MKNNLFLLPNGIKVDENIFKMFSWSRCSVDASYNGRCWDGSESWTILVECECGENRIIGLGWESRDNEGNWEVGIYSDQGFFTGEDAYEEACYAWNFRQ